MSKILPKPEREARDKKICKIYKTGKSVKQIADSLGTSLETVYKALNKYGARKKIKKPEPDADGVEMAKDLRVHRTCIADGKKYIDDTDFLIGR